MRSWLALAMTMALAVPALGAGSAANESCAVYLDLRERVAPYEVVSEHGLSLALSVANAARLELIGDVSGMASSAAAPAGEMSRTIMLTLDDGCNVTLCGSEAVDGLRVGDRVAMIASVVRSATSARQLVVEAWAYEWDLPREQPAPPEEPQTPSAVSAPPTDRGAFPQPAAAEAVRIDAIETWQAWVREHNPRLTEEQARNIVTWVLQYAQRYNVNHKLIFALIKWESWFDPSCVSHAGAIGLMQLMPGTARSLGVDPWNVQQNIEGGVRYLAEQLATYRGRPTYERVVLALACYNAGPNAVARAGHGVPNIAETQRYVRKVSSTFYELHQAGMP